MRGRGDVAMGAFENAALGPPPMPPKTPKTPLSELSGNGSRFV